MSIEISTPFKYHHGLVVYVHVSYKVDVVIQLHTEITPKRDTIIYM